MPIRLRDNPYRGVNAHLQSYLQVFNDAWVGFHASYIQRLRDAIEAQLPPEYIVISEASLQHVDAVGIQLGARSTIIRPDLTIVERQPSRVAKSPAYVPTQGYMLTVSVEDTLTVDVDESITYGLLIARIDNEQRHPITRIELLSPSNKRGGSGHSTYMIKRDEWLLSGLCLIEIDFLHHLPPMYSFIPDYVKREPRAQSFYLTAIDPRPNVRAGRTYFYSFGVDDAIPIINIPLFDDEVLSFDFSLPYSQMLRTHRQYQSVDYTELPLAFDSYSPIDQERIRARMDIIRREHEEAANANPTP